MTGTVPLLTPISMEALVVNEEVQNGEHWRRWTVDYDAINKFADPDPAGVDVGQKPAIGIHLHWALPKALTTGTQIRALAEASLSGGSVAKGVTVTNAGFGYVVPPSVTISGGGGTGAAAIAKMSSDGSSVVGIDVVAGGTGYTAAPRIEIAPSPQICFPLVPNRWLVTRYGPADATGAARATKSWVLVSDFLDPDKGSNPFVDPAKSSTGDVVGTKIGKSTVLSEWAGDSAGPEANLFLRAVGPGQASFHAYQPGIQDVFAFYDDLDAEGGTKAIAFHQGDLLSYTAVGWYSDPSADPMYGPVSHWGTDCSAVRMPWSNAQKPVAAWDDLIADLGWTVTDRPDDATQLPNQSAYHAMLHSVEWQSTGTPARVNQNADKMTVSVGQTGADALAALIKRDAQKISKASDAEAELEARELEALNFNALKTLDRADGAEQLDLQIRDDWYSTEPGGVTWDVVPANNPLSGLLPQQAPPPAVPLTPEQAAALAALNRQQIALDKTVRELQSMKFDLYAIWWKKNYNDNLDVPITFPFDWHQKHYVQDAQAIVQRIEDNLDPKSPDSLWSKIQTLEASAAKQAADLPVASDAQSVLTYADNVLKLDVTKHQLKGVAAPSFHGATDPVVLVSGIEPSRKQTTQHPSFDHTDGWHGKLLCRTINQIATGVHVDISGTDVPVTLDNPPSSGLRSAVPLIDTKVLGPGMQTTVAQLGIETFFMDPLNAGTIVEIVAKGKAQAADLATAMAAKTAQLGTAEFVLAEDDAYVTWSQAWSPLFLEWGVQFFPTVDPTVIANSDQPPLASPSTENADNWAFNLDGWAFDGKDYDWTGGNTPVFAPKNSSGPPPPPFSRSYLGRASLTQQGTFALISRLQHYIETSDTADEGLKKVEALIDAVGEMNFMSQRLTGFSDALAMRRLSAGNQPSPDIAPVVGADYNETPDPSTGNQNFVSGGSPFFFPVRGGFFVFDTLKVIDAYGQSLDLMGAGGNVGTGISFAPVRGEGMLPTVDTKITDPNKAAAVRMTPRLAQPARLNFDFLSATDDSKVLGQYAGVNPVCGWIIPNHLDRGLSVYDADGLALGEMLELANTSGDAQIGWVAAPGSPVAQSDPKNIANSHLQGFVTQLLARSDAGAGFRNFLSVVDETLWTVDPLGGRADQNLSVLIGRPLALVRARLGLELDGLPWKNQSWRDTMLDRGINLQSLSFPVRLGSLSLFDDGMMGYFRDVDYTTFNSVHLPEGHDLASGSYLKQVSPGNFIDLSFDDTFEEVTMILDPRGDIHAFTGVLPHKEICLPNEFVEGPMSAFQLTFRAGPLVSPTDQIRTPYPTERHGAWSWLQRSAPGADTFTTKTLVKAAQEARLDDTPPALVEGWLRFVPEQDKT